MEDIIRKINELKDDLVKEGVDLSLIRRLSSIEKDANKLLEKAKGNIDPTKIVMFSYHGLAGSMPKQMKEYFSHQDVKFDKDEMIDIFQYSEFQISNRWPKGK